MDFGEALAALKDGKRVRRPYWAETAFLMIVPGSTFTIQADRPLGNAAPALVGRKATYYAHIDMCTMSGGEPECWQWPKPDADLLADDWEIVALATGGVVSPGQAYIVGDGSREFETSPTSGAPGSVDVTINFTGTSLSEDDLAATIRRGLSQWRNPPLVA